MKNNMIHEIHEMNRIFWGLKQYVSVLRKILQVEYRCIVHEGEIK